MQVLQCPIELAQFDAVEALDRSLQHAGHASVCRPKQLSSGRQDMQLHGPLVVGQPAPIDPTALGHQPQQVAQVGSLHAQYRRESGGG